MFFVFPTFPLYHDVACVVNILTHMLSQFGGRLGRCKEFVEQDHEYSIVVIRELGCIQEKRTNFDDVFNSGRPRLLVGI